MDEKRVEKTKKKPSLGIALIPILCLILFLGSALIFIGADPHIPLILASCIAALIGINLGYTWDEIEKGFLETINVTMQACIILIMVGLLVGAWILCGTVPAMIYYGLMIINPKVFLLVACIICSIVSLATGSSWSTAGTVGVALMGIGAGLGIPAGMTAGAIVSGSYFGDKLSPLSDTTNLAPAVAGATLFEHIRHMIYTTTPSILIALVLYTIIGFKYGGGTLDEAQILSINEAIHGSFNINVLLLIPPVLVVGMVVFKLPAIPGLIGGTLIAVILFLIFQSGGHGGFMDIYGAVIDALHYGFVSETGNEMVDELLSRGGLDGMMWTVSLILCAMTFGGIMEKTGCLETLSGALLSLGKGTGSLVTITIFSSFFMNIIAGDQYMAIAIPGRMYKNEYRKRGLHPKNLSRALEDCGTLTSNLIPWNTCGAYMTSVLGVSPLVYAPYAFLNWINPFVSIFYGFTGITMEKLPEEELVKIRQEFADSQV